MSASSGCGAFQRLIRRAAPLVATLLVAFSLLGCVDGKGGGFGTVVCPCFCSLRDDLRFAGYWVNTFGLNTDRNHTVVSGVTWPVFGFRRVVKSSGHSGR